MKPTGDDRDNNAGDGQSSADPERQMLQTCLFRSRLVLHCTSIDAGHCMQTRPRDTCASDVVWTKKGASGACPPTLAVAGCGGRIEPATFGLSAQCAKSL